MKRPLWLVGAAFALSAGAPRADIILGSFDFNSAQFGNTLIESDGGTFSATSWLNVVNADPGNPGYLTGASFDTGIANVDPPLLYTIGYDNPIVNGPGYDLGVVTARYSEVSVFLTVSMDGGATIWGARILGADDAIATGQACNYFWSGAGPYGCELFVTPVDLSNFDVAPGESINSVQIGGAGGADLIRVAGFAAAEQVIPEPATLGLLGLGLAALGISRRRKQ